MQLVNDSSGEVICYDLFRCNTPQLLCAILLEYIARRELMSIFDGCISGAIKPGVISPNQQLTNTWFIERRPLPIDSDMHWISPANGDTYDNVLAHLGSGNIGDLMEAIGSVCGPHVKNLLIYQVNFAVVSHCGTVRLHRDNAEELYGDAWTVIIPLSLVNNSPPELVVQNPRTKKSVLVKYELESTLVFGPDTLHATAPVKYTSASRLCLILSVAYVTKENVSLILEDVTNIYPSKKLLMRWSCRNPHWRCQKSSVSISIPRIDDKIIYGMTWLKMFTCLRSALTATNGSAPGKNVSTCKRLHKWISEQRYFYSVKYAAVQSPSKIKVGRLMTSSREAKLKSIGFSFKRSRYTDVFQEKWMENFRRAQAFFNCHGHCMITPTHDVPIQLVRWVRDQRHQLKRKSNLTEIQLYRKELLKSIRFMFSIYNK